MKTTEKNSNEMSIPSHFALNWIPFLTLLQREIQRFYKVLFQTLIAPLISASLYFLIFGLSLKIQIESSFNYLAFLIPGLVMMGCLNHSFQNASSSIVSSRFSGELQDYKASPLSYQQIIWALSLGALIRGLLIGLSTYLLGQGFYYYSTGSLLPLHNFWIVLFFLCSGGIVFAQIGLSVAFWAKSFDQISAVGSFIITPLIYLGGVFFSIGSLPSFWQKISQFNVLFYFINGVRYGILGQSDVPILTAFLVSVGSVILFYIIALQVLKRSSFEVW